MEMGCVRMISHKRDFILNGGEWVVLFTVDFQQIVATKSYGVANITINLKFCLLRCSQHQYVRNMLESYCEQRARGLFTIIPFSSDHCTYK